ncbi:glycosyltransferase family 4 protein [Ophiostoma piceae UAMH 11346]|uniref:Alpha-1,3/1,6-mannosyltransferase ALG2 n=1 Tax=Ophiostoma piceae (strain UAMH 11346) TaxID=1262450 RepID=S3C281_OPHP1|nr:glycosyltransferase family 4 protein [Ophiostoma piceae UAMH 11346]
MAGKSAKQKKTIVFFHPDLGIGGAERLVVDAAVGLQNRGHRVVIFTSHCDPTHCFDEVRPKEAGGILDVRVRGGTVVPASVLGRFAIFCAIARQVHLLLQIWLTGELEGLHASAYFVDQLSAGLPLLRAIGAAPGSATATPIFFYCHFPDLLLAKGRQKWWKRVYRVPFDALEQWSMGFADAVAVNSRFTKSVVTATWPRLAAKVSVRTTGESGSGSGGDDDDKGLRVVYPCIDLTQEDSASVEMKEGSADEPVDLWKGLPFVLSINRFERKKDIGLAIRAFAGLPASQKQATRLVVAGGYDNRVAENVEYHRELDSMASGLGLRTATARTMVTALSIPNDVQVLFLLSVPSALKSLLLHSPSCRLLVYTPANEHFGIVPLEAMLAGLPVLACNSGGPTETVVEDVTGWLRPGEDVAAWTQVMQYVLPGGSGGKAMPDAKRVSMAAAGRKRVRSLFADTQMAARLDGIMDEIIKSAADGTTTASSVPVSASGFLLIVVALFGLAVALAAVILQRLL